MQIVVDSVIDDAAWDISGHTLPLYCFPKRWKGVNHCFREKDFPLGEGGQGNVCGVWISACACTCVFNPLARDAYLYNKLTLEGIYNSSFVRIL